MASSPTKPNRPLSPHLGIYKWGPHMLVSIVHRATGVGMALVGVPLFAWWLASAAGGEESAAAFRDVFTIQAGGLNVVGWVVGIGLTLAFFQHLLSGVRHFFMDVGALFELKANKTAAVFTIIGSIVLTMTFWAYLLAGTML